MRFNQDSSLRKSLLTVLAAGATLRRPFSQAVRRHRVQFLMLHDVAAGREQSFERLIDALSKDYRFISYSEAISRVRQGRIDDRYLALSFDDGFASCRRAADFLAKRNISACFFVCPSIIGETDPSRVAAFCRERLKETEVRQFLTWADLQTMVAAGHEIGGHTMTHPNLAESSEELIRQEIESCYGTLSQRLGVAPKHFCWPFGRFEQFSSQAAQQVFDSGFLSCASGERGCHIGPPDLEDFRELCVRRDNVDLSWPLAHIRYFLDRNARRADEGTNCWPFPVKRSAVQA